MSDMTEQTVKILERLVAFPTISSDSNLACINYIEGFLREIGYHTELTFDESGGKANIFACVGPDVSGGVMLSGHTDVVPVKNQHWTDDPFRLVRRDGKLFGRGSCDMKGFIAACMAMAKTYAALPLSRPLYFAFTYDEEVGCLGAARLAEQLASKSILPQIAIIGEPTEMKIIEAHKGCYDYTTEFHGQAGHSSLPGIGVNAIEFAVLYVQKLMSLQEVLKQNVEGINDKFTPPYATIQVGGIEGGVAHNVIPDYCKVDWQIRPIREKDADYVKHQLTEYCDQHLLRLMQEKMPEAKIVTKVIAEVMGLETMQNSEAVQLVSALLGSKQTDVVSFGTEAGIFQKLGMSALVCGPGSIEQAHKADEFVSIEQLNLSLDMLQKLSGRLID